jgi:hypothetical protein
MRLYLIAKAEKHYRANQRANQRTGAFQRHLAARKSDLLVARGSRSGPSQGDPGRGNRAAPRSTP